MSGSEETDESDQHDRRSQNADASGPSDEGAGCTADEIDAAGTRLLEWFRSLDRKEQIVVVASSLAIINESEDIATATAGVVDDIVSTESSGDSGPDSVHHTSEPDLSPPDPYPSPSYDTPESGEVDWHIPINENFDAIEDHVRFLSAKLFQLEGNHAELAERETEFRLTRLEMRLDAIEERLD